MAPKAKDKVLAAAVRLSEDGSQPLGDTVTLSNGIVLRIRKVPLLTIRSLGSALEEPQPPIRRNEEKAQDEVWEGDPAYQAAMKVYGEQVFDLTHKVFMLKGTSIEHVPEGLQRPEDEEWLEELRLVGIEVDASSQRARYLAWLVHYAVMTEDDISNIMLAVTMKTGVPEAEVQAAVKSFRGREARVPDNGLPSEDAG